MSASESEEEADDGIGLGFEPRATPTGNPDDELESGSDSEEDDKEATPERTPFNNGQHNSIATLTKTAQP